MSDLIAKLYRAIWSRVGGRTWTSITREDVKKSPLLYMLLFLGIGIILVKFGKKYWWQFLLAFCVGILTGHIFWP